MEYRNPNQFNLRVLLLFVALVAVLFAIIIEPSRKEIYDNVFPKPNPLRPDRPWFR